MKENVKVAAALLGMHERGAPLKIRDVAVNAEVHTVNTANFLHYWAAVGWLTKQKEGRFTIYSVTEKGKEGFAALVCTNG